ncbi:unnamed protein product [Brassica oleracea]|uniref:(rape) hypothetical protein n=1 Tax=Brassica napus TaxID=3708 RepID=A0A816TTD4_BRANA|nr:unnamed protein product [Brassica napus]
MANSSILLSDLKSRRCSYTVQLIEAVFERERSFGYLSFGMGPKREVIAEQTRNNMESNHEVYAMLKAAVKFFTQFSPWSSSLLNVFLPLTNRPGVLAGEATATKVTDVRSFP